jgi:hypothetical protein
MDIDRNDADYQTTAHDSIHTTAGMRVNILYFNINLFLKNYLEICLYLYIYIYTII